MAAKRRDRGASIFGYLVNDPENFGVVEFDDFGNPKSIQEKPRFPTSNYAVTGLYFYDNQVVEIAKSIGVSARGELEISDINSTYLARKELNVEILGRGFAWLDTGTHDSLIDAGQFVQTIEQRQGLKIACLEEIAFNNNWIKKDKILSAIKFYGNCSYSKYLNKILK